MVIHVLNQSFVLEGIIDTYQSVIWRPAYYDVGDFELYMGVTKEAVNLLRQNRYLVRDTDITVEDGVTTYTKVMIIKNIDIITDAENGDHISVTGCELKGILGQRIVWHQTNLTGTAENAIRRLVTENAVNPTDSARVIPTLVLGASAGLLDDIDKQITGEALDEAIRGICEVYGYGWDVFISDNHLVFVVYKGLDLSFGQSVYPYVVFSESFDNLYSSEYQLESEGYANTTLVAGEGEGTARKTAIVGGEHEGLDRFETYTDARDLSQNTGSSNAISDAEYLKLLQERGKETLAGMTITEGFGGEVLADVAYKYGTDFYLGDKVTVISKYGITRDVIVLSAIESIDESGETLIPQFNI